MGVRKTIAQLYHQRGEKPLALREYEAIAKLEPGNIDHLLALGHAYWADGQEKRALLTWAGLEEINAPPARFQHGDVLCGSMPKRSSPT